MSTENSVARYRQAYVHPRLFARGGDPAQYRIETLQRIVKASDKQAVKRLRQPCVWD